jgi:hypothetical protein
MVVVLWVGDLVARHAVAAVEAVQQAEREQLVDDAVDRGG